MTTGAGLHAALDGIDVAYYLIHSMEGAVDGAFAERERASADAFAAAAGAAGLRRVVYLGGLVPADAPLSRHLGSRLAVEQRAARRPCRRGSRCAPRSSSAPARARSASSSG